MGSTHHIKKLYQFLVARAHDQKEFSENDVAHYTGWNGTTPHTYLHKQVKAVVESLGTDKYKARKTILYLKEAEFTDKVSQKERILPCYKRSSYSAVVTYEFLMPLTKEDHLKRSLDELFYRDTLEQRIESLGVKTFETVVPRRANESADQYKSRLAKRVSDLFGGYSISHVNGRFRANSLMTQADAAGKRYIIDETTALVRFIIPCGSTRESHSSVFSPPVPPNNSRVAGDVREIRDLFLSLFAEIVVHSVQGEDEIWLLENVHDQTTLYKWSKD